MRLQALLIVSIMLTSCAPSPEGAIFSVATYNAYCLFDGIGDGDEFEGFRKADGYSEAVYDERIRNLAVMLGREVDADVIILEEVESEIVLMDLLERGLGRKGYRYYGLASDGSDAVNVGFVSRIGPISSHIHSFEGERPMLELSFLIPGGRVTVFGVHLRSRLETGSEDIRRGQLEHLKALIAEHDDSFVIVAGDFNLDPRRPDEPMSEYPDALSAGTVIPVSADPGRVGIGVMYSPLLDQDIALSPPGTYFYDDAWHIYDSIIMGKDAIDGNALEFESIGIVSSFSLLDPLSRPLRFDPSTGRGFSDHLPVIATFRHPD